MLACFHAPFPLVMVVLAAIVATLPVEIEEGPPHWTADEVFCGISFLTIGPAPLVLAPALWHRS